MLLELTFLHLLLTTAILGIELHWIQQESLVKWISLIGENLKGIQTD